MKLLIVADFTSSHTRTWASSLARHHEVMVYATRYRPLKEEGKPDDYCLTGAPNPWAIVGGFKQRQSARLSQGGAPKSHNVRNRSAGMRTVSRASPLLSTQRARLLAEASSVPISAIHLHFLIRKYRPDIVHAMRIPFEGIIALRALKGLDAMKMVLSIWGNDLDLFADRHPYIDKWARKVLHRVDALHVDCEKDAGLSRARGFSPRKPISIIPSGGGIDLAVFNVNHGKRAAKQAIGIRSDAPLIINPRGLRDYINNESFLTAITILRERHIGITVMMPSMSHSGRAVSLVRQLGLEDVVHLLPHLSRPELADLMKAADICVSPSTFDGMPNSLLEAMACGTVLVAGDIPSIRELVIPGRNGFLVDPNSADSIAAGVSDGLALAESMTPEEIAGSRAGRITSREDALAAMQALYGSI